MKKLNKTSFLTKATGICRRSSGQFTKLLIVLCVSLAWHSLLHAEELNVVNNDLGEKQSYLEQSVKSVDFIQPDAVESNHAEQTPTQLATLKPATDQPITQQIVINKHVTIEQKAYADYEQSMHYLEQGRVAEAQDKLRSALKQSEHFDDARQTLLRLLIERGRLDEALTVLQKGVEVSPANLVFAKGLARLKLGAGEIESAHDVLNDSLAYAEKDAAYHVLLATVLQKMNQHSQAIWHYKHAITTGGIKPVWLIGLGVSLEAEGYKQEAKTVFQRAAANRLNPTLAHYVANKLKQLD